MFLIFLRKTFLDNDLESWLAAVSQAKPEALCRSLHEVRALEDFDRVFADGNPQTPSAPLPRRRRSSPTAFAAAFDIRSERGFG